MARGLTEAVQAAIPRTMANPPPDSFRSITRDKPAR
jgi:hypothetical protein